MASNQIQAIRNARGDRKKELEEYDKYVKSMEAAGQTPKSLEEIRR